MLLSIIIPVYNVETYLAQCLDSVFSQDITGCEIICINDGSTDNSRMVLEEYKTKYPGLVIIDKENGGLSAARNSGLKIARGEYVYFLDSDDYLLPDTLSLLKSGINKNVDIVSYNSMVDENRKLYFNPKVAIKDILSGKDFFIKHYESNLFFPVLPVWMYLYKKDFLKKESLIFKENFLHEDIDFTSKAIFLANEITQFNEPVLYHRVCRKGSISDTIGLRNLEHIKLILIDVYQFYKKNNVVEPLFYYYLFELFLSVMIHLNKFYPKNIKYFFDKNEFSIIRNCVARKDTYIYYFLFRYFPSLFSIYISENTNTYLKKLLTKFFRLLDK